MWVHVAGSLRPSPFSEAVQRDCAHRLGGTQGLLLLVSKPAQLARSHAAAVSLRVEQHQWVPLAAQKGQRSRCHSLGRHTVWPQHIELALRQPTSDLRRSAQQSSLYSPQQSAKSPWWGEKPRQKPRSAFHCLQDHPVNASRGCLPPLAAQHPHGKGLSLSLPFRSSRAWVPPSPCKTFRNLVRPRLRHLPPQRQQRNCCFGALPASACSLTHT